MKKVATLFIAFVPLIAMAQKEIKPNVGKAEKAWREGKLDEAKEIIDVTVANNEYMVNKKGQPSKNAATAHYVRGLIYAAIDTSKVDKYKSLAENPFDVASAEFTKAEELDPKTGYFIKDPKTFLPVLTTQISSQYASYYANKAIFALTKEKDAKGSYKLVEHALYFSPKDTTILSIAGVYVAPSADEYDKSLQYIDQYIALGGQEKVAWQQRISIYQDKKKDDVLALKAIREAEIKFPKDEEFPKYELSIYLAQKDYVKARGFVTNAIKKYPDDPATIFMLGQLYDRTGAPDSARIAYQKTVNLSPSHFEANLELARSYYAAGRKIKQVRDKLGISASDIAQRKVLLEQIRTDYRVALPYWENCEKLKPENDEVLYTLNDIYSTLVMDEQQARIEKKIKALGLDK